MIVRDVLATKGSDVARIAPSASVTELVAELSEHRIGALVVTDADDAVVGIVSERDVARGLHTHGQALLQMSVGELMTTEVRTCSLRDTVEEVARTMTEARFRHLPVMDGGTMVGIVSLGDIVKKRIDELETEQDHLVGYISTA